MLATVRARPPSKRRCTTRSRCATTTCPSPEPIEFLIGEVKQLARGNAGIVLMLSVSSSRVIGISLTANGIPSANRRSRCAGPPSESLPDVRGQRKNRARQLDQHCLLRVSATSRSLGLHHGTPARALMAGTISGDSAGPHGWQAARRERTPRGRRTRGSARRRQPAPRHAARRAESLPPRSSATAMTSLWRTASAIDSRRLLDHRNTQPPHDCSLLILVRPSGL